MLMYVQLNPFNVATIRVYMVLGRIHQGMFNDLDFTEFGVIQNVMQRVHWMLVFILLYDYK